MTATPSDPNPSDATPADSAPPPADSADQPEAPAAPPEPAPVEAADVPAPAPAADEPTESAAPTASDPATGSTPTVEGAEPAASPESASTPAEATPAEATPAEATPAEATPAEATSEAAPTASDATPKATGATPDAGSAEPAVVPVESTEGAPTATEAATTAPAAEAPAKKKKKKKKPAGPDPVAVIKAIGTTSEAALAYVQNPDPKLSRMARKHREVIITDIPPVTAGALLGPDALCRHFLASAATGRYRDLFFLWDLFKLYPEECKAVLAQRQIAQEKAKKKLRTATHLGLLGDANRVAEDIDRAAGLPWRWMSEILEPMGPAIRRRPAVMAALARRDSNYVIELPDDPSDEWLAEAAQLRDSDAPVPEGIDQLLGEHADRLPATVPTLTMAQAQYPDRVSALIDRVDLDADDIGSILAWSRDHGFADQLSGRISERVDAKAVADRSAGLSEWKSWNDRGVDVALPESVLAPNLDGLDIGRPETADLAKMLIERGAELNPQTILDDVAADNRMRGEKAFENFVCAGFNDVHLPLALEGNPMVRSETRCPGCQAWTWVRPGHEKRCPRIDWKAAASIDGDTAAAAAAIDAAVAAIDAGVDESAVIPNIAPASSPRPSAPPTSSEPASGPASAPTSIASAAVGHEPSPEATPAEALVDRQADTPDVRNLPDQHS